MLALANAVEARDAYTGMHAQRVAAYGVRVAHAAGIEVDPQIEFGFLLHDIGKVAVPDAILFKPGPLTEQERALVRRAPRDRLARSCVTSTSSTRPRPSSGITTSAGTARATRTGSRARRSRCRHACSRSRTRSTRSRRTGRTAPPLGFADARKRIVAEAGTQFDPGDRGRLRDGARRRVRAHPGRAGVTRTILIVDDDPSIRKLITTTLEDVAGFRLREAGDGQEALEAAVEERPEIVFLDYDMPRLDGVETCRRLRSDPSPPAPRS